VLVSLQISWIINYGFVIKMSSPRTGGSRINTLLNILGEVYFESIFILDYSGSLKVKSVIGQGKPTWQLKPKQHLQFLRMFFTNSKTSLNEWFDRPRSWPGQLVVPMWRTTLWLTTVPSTCNIYSSSASSTPFGFACFCKCRMHLWNHEFKK